MQWVAGAVSDDDRLHGRRTRSADQAQIWPAAAWAHGRDGVAMANVASRPGSGASASFDHVSLYR